MISLDAPPAFASRVERRPSGLTGDAFAIWFWSRVEYAEHPGCWLWTGACSRDGYGHLKVNGRDAVAHRVAWELANGQPIREGLTIDHLCRTRGCVAPYHLEPTDLRTNIFRGTSPTALNARKTICARGHDLAGPDALVRIKPRRRNERLCLYCETLRARDRHRRRAAPPFPDWYLELQAERAQGGTS